MFIFIDNEIEDTQDMFIFIDNDVEDTLEKNLFNPGQYKKYLDF